MAVVSNKSDADIIRERMREIRIRLPQQVLSAKQDVKQLSDWKFYVRSYPAILLPLVSLAAFALIPKGKKLNAANRSSMTDNSSTKHAKTEQVAQRSFIAGVGSAVAGIALRSATSFALSHASGVIGELASRRSPRPTNSFDKNTLAEESS